MGTLFGHIDQPLEEFTVFLCTHSRGTDHSFQIGRRGRVRKGFTNTKCRRTESASTVFKPCEGQRRPSPDKSGWLSSEWSRRDHRSCAIKSPRRAAHFGR